MDSGLDMPPIDPANIDNVEPESPANLAVEVESATEVTPDSAPPVQQLPPLAGAGVNLTKIVLLMVSCVLVFLIALVSYQEIRYSNFTSEIFRKSLSEQQSWSLTSSLNSVLEDLRSAAKLPEQAKDFLQGVAEKVAVLEQGDIYEATLKDIEKDIRVVAAKNAEPEIYKNDLLALVGRTDARLKAMSSYSNSVEQIKANQELMKEYVVAANAAREFWMKIAQMILLNLLLPVLTALLGYVFASKAAENK